MRSSINLLQYFVKEEETLNFIYKISHSHTINTKPITVFTSITKSINFMLQIKVNCNK